MKTPASSTAQSQISSNISLIPTATSLIRNYMNNASVQPKTITIAENQSKMSSTQYTSTPQWPNHTAILKQTANSSASA